MLRTSTHYNTIIKILRLFHISHVVVGWIKKERHFGELIVPAGEKKVPQHELIWMWLTSGEK